MPHKLFQHEAFNALLSSFWGGVCVTSIQLKWLSLGRQESFRVLVKISQMCLCMRVLMGMYGLGATTPQIKDILS